MRPTASAPLVSVVMPAWNCERYIGRAIDSVLTQSLRDIELIVVDDGSTDNTPAVVSAFTDPRVRLLRGQCNRGPSHCRNRGIVAARGEWIALLDADDWFCTTRLETLCDRARREGVDAIADDLLIVNNGREAPRASLFDEAGFGFDDGALLSHADLLAHEIGALKPVFRRSLFSHHGHRYDERLHYGEDVMLYLTWLTAGVRLIVTRDALYCLRRGDTGSLTSSRVAMAQASLALNQQLLTAPALRECPETRAALVERIARSRDLLLFYQVVCPLRALDLKGAVAAFVNSPRFLLIALRRAPDILRVRLLRLLRLLCRQRLTSTRRGRAHPLTHGGAATTPQDLP